MITVFSKKLNKSLQIAIMSESDAVWYSMKAKEPYSMISITSKKDGYIAPIKVNSYLQHFIRFQFNDLDKDVNYLKAPIIDDFSGLKSFIDNLKSSTLIVHCGAGMSRSPGLMAAILEYLEVEDYSVFDDKRYKPNMLVYRLASQELGIGKTQEFYDNLFKEE